jgi:uncharacterized protein YnzC (UPF0291/DUF896 family)
MSLKPVYCVSGVACTSPDIGKQYCFKCKEAICSTSSGASHQTHQHSQSNVLTDELSEDSNEAIYDHHKHPANFGMEKLNNGMERTGKEYMQTAHLKWRTELHNSKLVDERKGNKTTRTELNEILRNERITSVNVLHTGAWPDTAEGRKNNFQYHLYKTGSMRNDFEASTIPAKIKDSLIRELDQQNAQGKS